MTTRLSLVSAALLTAFLAGTTHANAQSGLRPYVGGSLGAFSVSADEVDGRSVAAGFFGGLAVAKHVDVEFEASFPADTFTRSYTGVSVSFAPPGASRAEIERLGVVTRFDKEREITASVSAVAIIHPAAGKRLTPGLIVGVTNYRASDRTTYTPISIPEGVDPQHPAVVGRTDVVSRNIGGPTIGVNLAIALTPQLFIVPDVRYDYGSIGDEINNALRTSIRMQWRF